MSCLMRPFRKVTEFGLTSETDHPWTDSPTARVTDRPSAPLRTASCFPGVITTASNVIDSSTGGGGATGAGEALIVLAGTGGGAGRRLAVKRGRTDIASNELSDPIESGIAATGFEGTDVGGAECRRG